MSVIPASYRVCPRRPLYQQFISHLLLPFVLSFLLAAASTVVVGYGAEQAKQRAEQQELVDVYAHSLIRPLWDCDTTTLQGIVNALAHHQRIASVTLDDPCSGTQTRIEAPSAAPAVLPTLKRELVYRDELDRAHVVGTLSTRFYAPSIFTSAMEMFWRFLIVFIVVLSVMLVGALLAFRHIIGRPLQQFQAAIATGTAAAVNNDVPLAHHNDELGDVVHAYQSLIHELDTRYERQEILSRCARDLLSTAIEDHASRLHEVLDRVRLAIGADRLYLAQNDIGFDGRLRARHVALAGTPLPADLEREAVFYDDRDGRWQTRLMQHQAVFSTTDDEALLARHDALSLSAFPAWGQSQWYGYICVEDLLRRRQWSDSDLTFMQTVADIIGAFLEQAHHSRQLAQLVDNLRTNEIALRRMARHDPLTGLGNRIVLDEVLNQAIHRTLRSGIPGYVLMMDLNGFKSINDTFGHAVGDQVLQETARRLCRVTRATDCVIRLGGDEFVIVAEGDRSQPEIDTLVEKLRSAIAAPQMQGGRELRVETSIGVACFPRDGVSSDALMNHADRAMYHGKPGQSRLVDNLHSLAH